jgi:hypothetical protein
VSTRAVSTRSRAGAGRAAATPGTEGCAHVCPGCSRALARCEWCGKSDLLTVGKVIYPVTSDPAWDGNYHVPCHDALEGELRRSRPMR